VRLLFHWLVFTIEDKSKIYLKHFYSSAGNTKNLLQTTFATK